MGSYAIDMEKMWKSNSEAKTFLILLNSITDTHREKAASNKTPALTKSMNVDSLYINSISLQEALKLRKKKIQKNKVVTLFFL